jgi:general secretion pathway protein E
MISPILLASLPPAPLLISPIKLAVLAVLTFFWLWLLPKLNQDAIRLRLPREGCALALLSTGLAGLLLWLVLPWFLVGLACFVALAGGGVVGYVLYRNSQVEGEDYKIGTKQWWSDLFGGRLQANVPEAVTRVRIHTSDGSPLVLTESQTEDYEFVRAYNIAQEFLFDVTTQRANEVDVTPGEKATATVRFLIDGQVVSRPDLPRGHGEYLVQFCKRLAGLDINELTALQKGHFTVDIAGSATDVQVSTVGTEAGQRMQLKIMRDLVRTDFDHLGLDQTVAKRLRDLSAQPGLILVSGLPHSGVTSTQYALLSTFDAFLNTICTIEADPANELENVTQQSYDSPQSQASLLASTLRQEPDVILIDRCDDRDLARAICQAADTRRIIVGLRAPDAFTALVLWIRLVGEPGPALANLRAVTCQMLYRLLCQTCRQPYQPDEKTLAAMGLAGRSVKQLFRPPGDRSEQADPCPTCRDTHFIDRSAAFEFIEVTDPLREAIRSGKSAKEIKAAAQSHMRTFQQSLVAQIVSGQTSATEAARAQNAHLKAAKASGANP